MVKFPESHPISEELMKLIKDAKEKVIRYVAAKQNNTWFNQYFYL
jgi:hypothetical protein